MKKAVYGPSRRVWANLLIQGNFLYPRLFLGSLSGQEPPQIYRVAEKFSDLA